MKLTKELAEFFGILTGDGYVNQYILSKRKVSVLEITGNKEKDFDYLNNYVSSLIKRLFNIYPNIYLRDSQNTIRVIIYSKEIVGFIKESSFPFGNKGEIKIPEWVRENEIFFRNFVMGFFDTDGHLTFKNKEGKKYPSIGLTSKSKSLLILIKDFLDSLDISSYLGERIKDKNCYKLEINGKKNINLFFEKIGSNNKRNKIKYNEMHKL